MAPWPSTSSPDTLLFLFLQPFGNFLWKQGQCVHKYDFQQIKWSLPSNKHLIKDIFLFSSLVFNKIHQQHVRHFYKIMWRMTESFSVWHSKKNKQKNPRANKRLNYKTKNKKTELPRLKEWHNKWSGYTDVELWVDITARMRLHIHCTLFHQQRAI